MLLLTAPFIVIVFISLRHHAILNNKTEKYITINYVAHHTALHAPADDSATIFLAA